MGEDGAVEDAAAAYQAALICNRWNMQAHYNLGLCCSSSENRRAALMHFKEFLKLDPATRMRLKVRRLCEQLQGI